MLDVMRKNVKKLNWILWAVILSFVMTIFLVWGMNAGYEGGQRNTVAQVNGKAISRQQLNEEQRNLTDQYRRMLGERFDELAGTVDLQQQALGRLVQRELVAQEAERLGIEVSDQALGTAISQDPMFFDEQGRFTTKAYRERLGAMGRRPGEYEQTLRRQMQVARVYDVMTGLAQVTDQEIEDLYKFRNDEVSVDAIVLTEADVQKEVTLTDADKKAYFEAHKAAFAIPETVQADYVLADRNKLAEKLQLDPNEVSAFYEEHKQERYHRPEEVNARHILFKIEPGATVEQKNAVRERAQKVHDEIVAGRDFIEAANAVTEDEAGKGNGGTLGWFGRGRMVAPFEEKAFSLAAGELSEPVETEFGYHLIRVDEKRPEGFQPLSDVEPQIQAQLKREKVAKLATDSAEAARQEMVNGKSAEEAAAAHGLEAGKTGFFGLTDDLADGIRDPALNRTVFAMQPGNVSDVLSGARGFFVFKLNERRAPHDGTLEEVDKKLTAELRTQKAVELIKAKADQIKVELTTKPFSEVAKAHGTDVKKTPVVHRDGSVNGLGRLKPEVEASAFAAEPGSIFGPIQLDQPQGVAFLRLVSKKPADMAELEKSREQLAQEIRGQKQDQLIQDWLGQLQARAKIHLSLNEAPRSRGLTPEDLGY